MMRRRILAIATALILGIASTSGAALAHGGGGGGGGHGGGGFGGGHAAGFGGGHFGGGFGGRIGEAHGFAMRGGFDGPSFAHHDMAAGISLTTLGIVALLVALASAAFTDTAGRMPTITTAVTHPAGNSTVSALRRASGAAQRNNRYVSSQEFNYVKTVARLVEIGRPKRRL